MRKKNRFSFSMRHTTWMSLRFRKQMYRNAKFSIRRKTKSANFMYTQSEFDNFSIIIDGKLCIYESNNVTKKMDDVNPLLFQR